MPWMAAFCRTSADLFKTMFDLLVSVTVFVGRFDMRMMQVKHELNWLQMSLHALHPLCCPFSLNSSFVHCLLPENIINLVWLNVLMWCVTILNLSNWGSIFFIFFLISKLRQYCLLFIENIILSVKVLGPSILLRHQFCFWCTFWWFQWFETTIWKIDFTDEILIR